MILDVMSVLIQRGTMISVECLVRDLHTYAHMLMRVRSDWTAKR